jgi:mannose-6-phosphate isomerase-like protein (cupin superfamily)
VSQSRTELFALKGIEQRRTQTQKPYLEFLRMDFMSAGLYVLAPGAADLQRPHHEDELYYVVRGRARFHSGGTDHEVFPGSVIFVAAHVEHSFYDITEELAVLVVFAPAET